MLPLLLFLVVFFPVALTAPPPAAVVTSSSCVVCQLSQIAKLKNQDIERQQANVEKHCKSSGCEKALTHCQVDLSLLHLCFQIVEQMMIAHISDRDFIKELKPIEDQCHANPNAMVLANMGPLGCLPCRLIYKYLEEFDTALKNAKVPPVVGALAYWICPFIVALTHHKIENPAICGAAPPMVRALDRAIRDSLGSFYNAIAVNGFGCPDYPDFQSVCQN